VGYGNFASFLLIQEVADEFLRNVFEGCDVSVAKKSILVLILIPDPGIFNGILSLQKSGICKNFASNSINDDYNV